MDFSVKHEIRMINYCNSICNAVTDHGSIGIGCHFCLNKPERVGQSYLILVG